MRHRGLIPACVHCLSDHNATGSTDWNASRCPRPRAVRAEQELPVSRQHGRQGAGPDAADLLLFQGEGKLLALAASVEGFVGLHPCPCRSTCGWMPPKGGAQ